MIHVVLNLTKHYELCCEEEVVQAVVELTPELCREALRRMDLWLEMKKAEADLSDLVFWDDNVIFLQTELIQTEEDKEGIPTELATLHFLTRQPIPFKEAGVNEDVGYARMYVDEVGIYWKAYEDHVEMSFETYPIPREVLQWALDEQSLPVLVA